MGLIYYHRAGVAKRQARAAIRASRRLEGALGDVEAENERLAGLVERRLAPNGLRRPRWRSRRGGGIG
jgi:hypothetical protein